MQKFMIFKKQKLIQYIFFHYHKYFTIQLYNIVDILILVL